jgi:hypothetical protein
MQRAVDPPPFLLETVARSELTLLEDPPVVLADLSTAIATASATLGARLHPRTVVNLADLGGSDTPKGAVSLRVPGCARCALSATVRGGVAPA